MSAIWKVSQKIILIFLLFTICFSFNVFPEEVPREVLAAAKNGIIPFLKTIPEEDRTSYGFGPEDPIDQAEVDIPFRVYTITPSALSNYCPGDTVSSLLSPTGMWYFPVMIKGNVKALLIVDQMNGSWEVVSVGYVPLTGELQQVMSAWPRAEGYEPLLIIVFQAATSFFTIPQKDAYNLTPLLISGQGLGAKLLKGKKDYSSLIEISQIVDELKAAVEKNISQNY